MVERGDLIEDYPEDARGRRCLMHGKGLSRRNIHVVCSPKEDFLAIITAYLPSERVWDGDLGTSRGTTPRSAPCSASERVWDGDLRTRRIR